MDQIIDSVGEITFPDKTFNILDFGAVSDGVSDNSKAFQKAIKECTESGGGKVIVPNGKYLTGPIHLKSNVNLHLEEGAEILFSTNPTISVVNNFSNELCVNSNTPRAFLVHATDDSSVSVENSIMYYQALKRNHVSAELHLFEKGGLGFGLGVNDTSQYWTKDCENWLKSNHIID